ncbi:aminoglycoside phosphotransferase family protein [Streptomyces sp. NPDC102360]|uniref:aminoglycoside phosphotransferase family protein n=1 Tax=Streptomyces sp. NPDC102360 TaxID=3366160 RepID=UPI00382A4195
MKQYQRWERFESEVRALRILDAHGLSPLLREACAEHCAVRIERVAGKTLAGPLVVGSPGEEGVGERLGRLVRRLHEVPSLGGVGPLNTPVTASWQDFLLPHLDRRIEALHLADHRADRLRTWFAERIGDLTGQAPAPRLLHHDLKPANILVRPGGSVMLCDFDQARGGDPFSDLGKLWWRTFDARPGRAWSAFRQSYGADARENADDTIRFYLVVHCLGALAYWHDYARPRYFRHARSAAHLITQHTGTHCPLETREPERSPW